MKRTKLFLTGMAALALSLGLLFTGCDDGGSDPDSTQKDTEDTSAIYKSTKGSDTYVLILENNDPAAGDDFILYKGVTASFGANTTTSVSGTITGSPSPTSIVLRPSNGNINGADDITATIDADGKLTTLASTGSASAFAATGLTGVEVETLAGSVALDKTAPKVGETITATLTTTTPASFSATTHIVTYNWYEGTASGTITTPLTAGVTGNTCTVAGPTGKFFKVDVRVIGYKGIKTAATTTASAAAPTSDVSTAAAINVAQGDTSFKVTSTGGTLAGSLKVFVSGDGATVTLTADTTVSGAFQVTASKVTQTTGKIVVTGLNAAVASPSNGASTFALKSGNAAVTVTLKADAQTLQVTSIAAKTGVPAVLPNEAAYEFVANEGAVSGNKKIFYDASGLAYQLSGTRVPTSGQTPLDADFDADLIAALTDLSTVLTSASVGTFGVTGGAVTAIATVAAATVPAGTDFFFPGATVSLAVGAFTVEDGASFTAGTADDNVTFKGAVITADTGAIATTGAALATIDLTAQAHTIALADGGSIATAGAGKLVVGKTEFSGAGIWTASLGTSAASITITSNANGAVITAPSGTAESSLTATGTPVITQNSGSGNTLTLTGYVTINLGGTNASPAGSIVLVAHGTNTNGGTITLSDTNGLIKTGNTGAATAMTAGASNLTIGGKGVALNTITYANVFGSGSATGSLSKIGGVAGNFHPIGTTPGTNDVTLAADKELAGTGT
jgi:hypothetical protein